MSICIDISKMKCVGLFLKTKNKIQIQIRHRIKSKIFQGPWLILGHVCFRKWKNIPTYSEFYHFTAMFKEKCHWAASCRLEELLYMSDALDWSSFHRLRRVNEPTWNCGNWGNKENLYRFICRVFQAIKMSIIISQSPTRWVLLLPQNIQFYNRTRERKKRFTEKLEPLTACKNHSNN